MRLSDFQYELPPELIARYPLANRTESRMLLLKGKTGEVEDRQFIDILSLITPNDLLVFNNTRVIAARLFGQKATGGKVEILLERILDSHRFLAHVRASKAPKLQSQIFCQGVSFRMLKRHENLFELQCEDKRPVLQVIETIGHIPLPPYFHRDPEECDKERYQTVYAEHEGSVAAPTAGLHFDEKILGDLKQKGVRQSFVTLHVGAGTFAPVKTENILDHQMHSEFLNVSAKLCEEVRQTKARGGRVIAVGSTSARSLETACQSGQIEPFQGETKIFIYPGYQFKCVDVLLTNLHLPGSTLLMMVAAFAGYENTLQAYKEAVKKQYRFFSYGDAMWVTPAEKAG